ncbi:trypsin-like serine protease [Rubripirellula obstinata]|uniref:trypsin-like serine protease n=1 Tax=Rubripirellula obstinata TaxID=406547 RepID=UPI000830AE8A|nr:trypsin-like serine protease [Rubripirellula obstinata]
MHSLKFLVFLGSAFVASLVSVSPALAIVWRDNLSDAEVQALAMQGQFQGVGTVGGINSGATGVAIAPGWVLTARHVVGNESFATFRLNGVTYSGVSLSRAGSDVALIQLNPGQQLPASTPFISPNPNQNSVNQLVWKVGWGEFSSRANSQTNRGPFGQAARAGTNVVDSSQATFFGPSLVINNNNTSPNSTSFEVSTAPGDSGGPMFLQHNNQWFISGVTSGVIGGVGFIEANVASDYNWIQTLTGLPFTPQAAPTKVTFDRDFTTEGVQSGNLPGFSPTWNNDRPMFYANGFNYTWENDAPPVAVFGTADTSASIVTVTDDIVFSGIEFAPTSESSGPFQIVSAASGGTLAAISGGAFIEANRFGAVGANLTGTNDITKTGPEGITLTGDNSNFDAELIIADGFVRINSAEALGTGGFVARTKTVVQDGATLQLTGPGISSAEHMHISGQGDLGNGAIFVSDGNHTLTERIALRGDATINVNANASLTIGGDQRGDVGRFYEGNNLAAPPTLTQDGAGTVVYDQTNTINRLAVINGVAAGDGSIGGTLALTTGAELRPGDSAMGSEYGTFSAADFSMDSESILSIDLDPESMLADLVDVTGTINLAGTLNLNLFSAPSEGDEFMIFENGGTDLVMGLFASGNQVSAMFGGQSYDFAINYAGGTGNDVFLSFATAIPEPSTFALLSIAALASAARRRKSSH